MCGTFPGEVRKDGRGVKMLLGNAGNLPQDDQVSWPSVLLLAFSRRAALYMHPQRPRPSHGAHQAVNAVMTPTHFQSGFIGTGAVDGNSQQPIQTRWLSRQMLANVTRGSQEGEAG